MSEDKAQEELKELFFSIYYDAEDEDLNEHRMPAYKVANAIKQMSILVAEADKTLHGKENSLELFISAPAEPGSLGIEFFVELINPENAKLLLQSLGFLSVGVGMAKGMLKKPKEDATDDCIEEASDEVQAEEPVYKNVLDVAQQINGATSIDFDTTDESDIATLSIDGKEVKCKEEAARLISNPKIRTAVHSLITEPVEDYESPTIFIGETETAKTNPVIRLESEHIKKIEKLLVPENEPKQHNMKATVTFTRVNFESNKGWKMRLDGKQVGVTIADEAFIKRVNSNSQKFVKSDEYNVELTRVTTYNSVGKEKDSYTLTKAKKKPKLK